MNYQHLVGCPGTGKTHALMGYLGRLMEGGIAPEQICFTSFTKAATEEAAGRVTDQFGVGRRELPYFGTLHSLAYRHLQLGRENVMERKRWKEFCQGLRLEFTENEWGSGAQDEDPAEPLGTKEGDVLKRFYEWQRNLLLTPDDAFQRFDPGPVDSGWSRGRVAWFVKEYEAFKNGLGLYDFTDMLLELDKSGWRPPVRVLIGDELQDLSPLQRRIFLRWANQTGNVLLAYDEDQAIFEFQGAEPGWLLQLDGERKQLLQSYRVPQRPAALAQRIIKRNRLRYEKEWRARPEEGSVQFDMALYSLVKRAADPSSGSWYFLARNRYYLDAYCEALREYGVPYENLRGPTPQASGAVLIALQLASGEQVSLDDLNRLAERTAQDGWWMRGAKADLGRAASQDPRRPVLLSDLPAWGATPLLSNALAAPTTCLKPLKTTEGNKAYFRRVWARYGASGFTCERWCKVSTMHGVKGGGARNVVLNPSMTRRTAEGFEERPEPERRVWYVGASRTEENLYVLEAGGGAVYDEW